MKKNSTQMPQILNCDPADFTTKMLRFHLRHRGSDLRHRRSHFLPRWSGRLTQPDATKKRRSSRRP
jgi:hypothetical protein